MNLNLDYDTRGKVIFRMQSFNMKKNRSVRINIVGIIDITGKDFVII